MANHEWIEFKERVREANPLEEVCCEDGVELTGPPEGPLRAICPFHEDSKPSLHVYVRDQRFRCYGCHASGDVFEYVGRRDGCSFSEALRSLAERASIPLPQWTPEERAEHERLANERRRVEDIWRMAVAHWHQALPPEVRRKWYHERYEFTDETVDGLKLGFADGGVCSALQAEGVSAKELIQAALAVSVGGELKDLWEGRLTFPYWRNGRVVYLIARKTEHTPNNAWEEAKYRKLPTRSEKHSGISETVTNDYFFYEDAARGADELLITEGVTDCIAANQAGLACISPGTTQFRSEDTPKLLRLCRPARRTCICNDAEESESGLTGALQTARTLDAEGIDVRLVELPRPGGVEKTDLCDFLRANGAEAFRDLLGEAKSLLEFLAVRLPSDPGERADGLREIMDMLAAKDTVGRAGYREHCTDLFGLAKREFDEALREAKARLEPVVAQPADGDPFTPAWQPEDPGRTVLAQDFRDGLACFTVHLPTQGGRMKPFLVRSDRKLVAIGSDEARRMGVNPEPSAIPFATEHGWSTGTEVPNSVHAFIQGRARVDPVGLWRSISDVFREFLVYPDDRYHDLLALWAIGTYVFLIFEAYPYLLLTGPKRVGKSRSMELLEPICFNATMAASVSDAVIFRWVAANRGTLLVDEAENLARRRPGDDSERIEIYNSGYRRSGMAYRCVGEDHEPKGFPTYSPKCFANVRGLQPLLADRAIHLHLTRTDRQIPKLISRNQAVRLRDIRNSCYVFAMDHHSEIATIHEQLPDLGYLRDREDELWEPILTIAELIDVPRLEADSSLADSELLVGQMRSLARDLARRRQEEEGETDLCCRIIEAIGTMLDERPPMGPLPRGEDDELYPAPNVVGYLRHHLQLERLTQTRVTKALARETGILDPDEGGKPRKRVDGRQVIFYRIRREAVADAARRFRVNWPMEDGIDQQDDGNTGDPTD